MSVREEHMAKSLAAMTARRSAPPSSEAETVSSGTVVEPQAARSPLAWLEQNCTALVLLATVCVLAVGLVYAVALGNEVSARDDAVALRLADRLAGEGTYSLDGSTPSAARPPAYPVLLAGLRLLDAPVVVLRMLNMVLLALTVPAVAALAGALAGPLAAIAGAALVGAYPLFLYTAGPVQPRTLAALLLVTGVLALVKAATAGTARARALLALGGGLAFGLLTLTAPLLAVAFVPVSAWLVYRLRTPGAGRSPQPGAEGARSRRMVAVLTLALIALVLLPGLWTVRNAVQFGAFVPVTTSGGYELLRGNSEHAGFDGGREIDISGYEASARGRTLGEVETDRYYRASALTWIAQHPGEAVAGYVQKLVNLLAVRDGLATPGRTTDVTTAVIAAVYLPLLALFLTRLTLWRRRRPGSAEVLVTVVIAGSALLLAIAPTRVTSRVPLDVLLCVIVATLAPILTATLDERRRAAALLAEQRPALDEQVPAFELQPSAEYLTLVSLNGIEAELVLDDEELLPEPEPEPATAPKS
jgi:4-amino-4-deoxy-L-arabinose transferase-like glycosyltransferase